MRPFNGTRTKTLYGAISATSAGRICEDDGIMSNKTAPIDGNGLVDINILSCEDLSVQYETGRNVVISGSGRNQITKYRIGVQTNIGDIEISVWVDLMWKLIIRLGETRLQEQLQQWAKENCAWLHTQTTIEREALKLHAARIFDNSDWVGYVDFNRRYRPNLILKDSPNGGKA